MEDDSDPEGNRWRDEYGNRDPDDKNGQRGDSSDSSGSQGVVAGDQGGDAQSALAAVHIGELWDIILRQVMKIHQLEILRKRMESAMQQQLPAAVSRNSQELLDLVHCRDQQIRNLTMELQQLRQEKEMMEERTHQQLEPNLQISKQRGELLRIETEAMARWHETHLASLVEEMESLKCQLLTVQDERDRIMDISCGHEATIQRMETQRDEMTLELVKSKEERDKVTKTNEICKDEAGRLNAHMCRLTAEMKELKDQNYRITKKLEQQTEETVAILAREKEQFTLKVKELKEENDQLVKTQEHQVSELVKEVKKLETEKGEMKSVHEEEVAELTGQTSQLKHKLEKGVDIRADLESQMAQLKSALSDMTCALNRVQPERKREAELTRECEEAKDAEKLEADEVIHQLGAELRKIREEKETLAAQNLVLTARLEEQEKRFGFELLIAQNGEDSLRKEIADLTKRLRAVEQEKREKAKGDIAVRAMHERKYSPPGVSERRPLPDPTIDSGIPASENTSKE